MGHRRRYAPRERLANCKQTLGETLKKIIALSIIIFSIFFTQTTSAHYKPNTLHIKKHAINLYWCGKTEKYCEAGRQAWEIAGCETGNTYNIWAKNGQYLGIFQMGSFARSLYGHGWNVWDQAKAAHKYYVASGRDWSPWTCRWAAY